MRLMILLCVVSFPTLTWGTRFPLQVPYFNWSNPAWVNQQLGSCPGVTVGSAGCAVTSAAMVLAYYGADVDPGRLNTWLKNNGGYSECAIYWEKPPYYQSGLGLGLALKKIPMNPFDWNRLKSELDNCHPVIVHVIAPGKGDHYVVVKGYSGNRFHINDSYLNKQWLDEYGTPDQMIVYYGNTCKQACPSITLGNLPPLPCASSDGTGIAYTAQLSGNGGQSPYTFKLTGGFLPPGLTLSSSGLLTGTITANPSATEKLVALQAYNGKFVAADFDKEGKLIADRDQRSTWETFKLLYVGNEMVALQAYNGKFVSSDFNREGFLIADREQRSTWGNLQITAIRKCDDCSPSG